MDNERQRLCLCVCVCAPPSLSLSLSESVRERGAAGETRSTALSTGDKGVRGSYRANMPHIRQNYGLGFQVKILKTF